MLRAFSHTFRTVQAEWRRFWRDDRGATFTGLVVVPVLAVTVAIGVETGQIYRVKRQMQGAADAAALAGSVDRLASKSNDVITATARYEAQRNGFTHNGTTVNVTVNSPPTSGGNVSTTGAVEVRIQKSLSLSFGNLLNSWLGRPTNTFTLTARSVAAQGTYTSTSTSSEGCIVALTTSAEQGVSLSSFNNLNSDCTIMSNGSATGTGSGASVYVTSFNTMSLKSIWTRGTLTISSGNHTTYTDANAPLTNQTTYAVDPYASLGTPSPGGCTYTNYVEPSGSSLTLNPGTYCGGLSVVNKSNVYFTHGTYYIANGDLVIRSDNNVSCSDCTTTDGLTFVLTQTTGNNSDIGGVSITSENNVTLAAGTSGTYPGVLFYQDRRATTGTMTSTSRIFTVASLNNANLYGAVYFPNNRIDISSVNNFGGNASTGCTIWIGRYIKFSSFNNVYKGGCSTYGTSPVGLQTTTTVTKGRLFE